MYVRPKLAGLVAALVTSATLFLSGCSSSQPRDINYGTDVGVGYVPPDVASTSPDSATIDAGNSADSTDAMDVGTSFDSVDDVQVAVDASIDGET